MNDALVAPRESEWLPGHWTSSVHGPLLVLDGVPIHIRNADRAAGTFQFQYADIVDPPHDALVERITRAVQVAG